MRKCLREENYTSARGEPGRLEAVFVDEEEFPGAIRPFATYTVEGKYATVKITLRRDGQKVAGLQVEGAADDPGALVAKMMEAISEAMQNP